MSAEQGDQGALLRRIEQLERRAQAAEDYRELVNLQGAYGYFVDKGLWDKAADLFAAEGTLEIAGRGEMPGDGGGRECASHEHCEIPSTDTPGAGAPDGGERVQVETHPAPGSAHPLPCCRAVRNSSVRQG